MRAAAGAVRRPCFTTGSARIADWGEKRGKEAKLPYRSILVRRFLMVEGFRDGGGLPPPNGVNGAADPVDDIRLAVND